MIEQRRVELQAELAAPREEAFRAFATAEGLRGWVDEADLEPRVGGAVRLRLRDAVVTGRVVAIDPPQHLSFSWDYPDEPLDRPTIVAFDAIDHGASRTHVTVRHVGFESRAQLDLHDALWHYWFRRFCRAVEGELEPGTE